MVVPVLADEPYQSHSGPYVVDRLGRQMLDLDGRCMQYKFQCHRLVMRQNEPSNFSCAIEWYICPRPFKNDKVRDPDHLTGKYRGAAHERCNIMLRKTYKVPVFFHNFRGYHSHLIVSGLRSLPGLDINIIGQRMEKELTLGWGEHLMFKESLQFLASSLETLASNHLRSGK